MTRQTLTKNPSTSRSAAPVIDTGSWGHDHTACRSQAEHGTTAGAQHHRARDEKPCTRCAAAANHASNESRRRRHGTPTPTPSSLVTDVETGGAVLAKFAAEVANSPCMRPDLGNRCECWPHQARRALALAAQ